MDDNYNQPPQAPPQSAPPPVQPSENPQTQPVKICPKCGNVNVGESKNCLRCACDLSNVPYYVQAQVPPSQPAPPPQPAVVQPTVPTQKPGNPQKNTMAIIGMILGIVSVPSVILVLPIAFAISGLVLSIIGMKSQKKTQAIVGLCCNLFAILFFIVLLSVAINPSSDAQESNSISVTQSQVTSKESKTDTPSSSAISSEQSSSVTESEVSSDNSDVSSSEPVPEKEETISDVLKSLGFSDEEAELQSEKFLAVGITKISEPTPANPEGTIDTLQAFVTLAQNEEKFTFTVDQRDIFYIYYYNTALYDRDNGGVLDQIENVHVPESKVSSAMYADLQFNTKDVIKKVLKSPSTAKFPWLDGWMVSRADDIYRVTGYVDAQNSFGAMIRSHFSVTWEVDQETNKMKVIKVVFDGQEIPVS